MPHTATGTRPAQPRVISSPYQGADVDPETAEEIERAVDRGLRLRHSAAADSDGRQAFELELFAITTDDGRERFAARHARPEGVELVDSDQEAVAEAWYEDEARAIEETGAVWDTTDVAGVRTGGYTYTVETSSDGGATWRTDSSGSSSLGREDDPAVGFETVARERGEREAKDTEDDNLVTALEKAAGIQWVGGPRVHVDMLRVTVTPAAGEPVTWEREFAPPTPTGPEAARYRAQIIAAQEEALAVGFDAA
ncbi:hypothetical protein [Kitasatospora griseola]|uniref:hypothetical protein n=1 Tax=Kitasatospora griseola TaxID=2064 RepID=UPI00341E6ACB